MCRYTTLVWLGVMAFVAQGEKKTVIGPTTPVSIVGTSNKAFDFSDLSWVTSALPSSDWNVAGWMRIQLLPDQSGLFNVISTVNKPLYVAWPYDNTPYSSYDGASQSIAGIGNRPVGKWVHMVLGCDTSLIYFIITLRTATNSQYYVTTPSLIIAVGASFRSYGPHNMFSSTVRIM